MTRSTLLAALGAVLATAILVPPAAADNSQQTKMTTCSADAKSKGLSGDDRKKFMSDCLKGSAAPQ